MLNVAKRSGWVSKPLFSLLLLLLVCGTALAADAEGAGKGRNHQRRNGNIGSLDLTEQQQADLAVARQAALEATKGIEDPKERGKAISEQMAAAKDTILTDEQKARLQELRENHKGRGKGNAGPGGVGRGKGSPGPGGQGHGKGSPGPGGQGHGKGSPGPGGRGHGSGETTPEEPVS